MNKSVLIIAAEIESAHLVPQLRDELLSYLGSRMAKTQDPSFPTIYVERQLDEDDFKYIDHVLSETYDNKLAVIFAEEGAVIDDGYKNIIKLK